MHATPITPAWIIEDLRRQREEREERERARLELPLPLPRPEDAREDDAGRPSVCIIELWS
jgi:hypothetical protein